MAIGITSRFNAYKKQGLTDSVAMERAMKDQAAYIVKIRKADAAKTAKKKETWAEQLKKKIRIVLAGKETATKKRYLSYVKKVGIKKDTLSYVQWKQDQRKKK